MATGRRDGLPGPARTKYASPEALARQARTRADRNLNSVPVVRAFAESQAFSNSAGGGGR